MKKYLLFLVVAYAVIINSAKAQYIIPNTPGTPPGVNQDGFETWANDPLSNIKDPWDNNSSQAQWQCLNILASSLFGNSPQSVFQDSTTVHGGKYSCRIVSVVLNATGYSYVKSFLPHDTVGVVLGATITFNPSPNIVPGLPFNPSHRIDSLIFYYQYAPQNNSITHKPDTAYCSVTVTHRHNVIGGGLLSMNSTSGNWVKAMVPILYDSGAGHNPDTIDILFSSSSLYAPVPGSTLIIDDGQAVMGINDNINAVKANVDVYPNPASTQVNFKVSGSGINAYGIEVYDITGKKISTNAVKDNMASINTSTYASGLYIYQVYDKSGALMNVGKFSIDK